MTFPNTHVERAVGHTGRMVWPSRRRGQGLSLGLSALVLAVQAVAQTAPDAGSLLQQRPPPPTPARQGEPVQLPAETRGATTPSGPQVRVTGFVFEGQSRLSADALQAVVAPWLGKTATLADLQRAAVAVAEAHRASGALAQVTLPPQDITSGQVRLRIDEAVFGQPVVVATGSGLPTALIESLVTAAHAPGPLDLPALERGLLLAQDVPGLRVSGSLQAGSRPGSTDLRLDVQASPAWYGQLRLDNSGARATGAARLDGTLWLPNLLGLGDEATANAGLSEGHQQVGARLNLPVGRLGTRADAHLGYSRHRLVSREFKATAGKGDSVTLGLQLRHPLVRQRDATLHAWAGVEWRSLNNQAAGVTTSDYRTRGLDLGLDGRRSDAWLGGGSVVGSAVLTLGRVNLAGSPHAAADAATVNTGGDFTKLRVQLGRSQSLGTGLMAQVNLSGQWANRNLDSSEKFSLGGPYGVRAYPVGEGSGATGMLASAELRGRMPEALATASTWPMQWLAFVDAGQTQAQVNAGFPGAQSPNRVTLKGAGFGLQAAAPGGVSLQASLARRIGRNPYPTASGTDQDGSLKRWRLWLGMTANF